ncbi:Aspartate ammonia-lyase [Candidatus Nitrosotalea sp. TS]|nr:Aspartate ammonia-lyase [Candidatus Nitrosotalea sp. TS]
MHVEYRTERDSLGEVKIPSDAYYGAFTSRAINQYHVTGLRPHINLIMAFVMIKRSAAVANMKTRAIDAKRGNAIVNACDKILAGKFLDQFLVEPINSGAGTAFNMNTNEVISNVALEILGKRKETTKSCIQMIM